MSWVTEASITTPATPAAVWALYADVPNWPRWDTAVVSASLHGPLVAGARGVLTPKGAPPSPFVVTAATPERGFADVTALPHPRLPLARLAFEHELTPLAGGGTRITHRVRIAGLLGAVVARLLGPALKAGLPGAVQALGALAAKTGAATSAA